MHFQKIKVKSGEQILVGGNDMYVSLCRKHYNDGRLGPEKQAQVKQLSFKIGFKNTYRRIISILLALLMIAAIFSFSFGGSKFIAYAEDSKATIVTTNGLNVRSGPGTTNPIIICLPYETEVLITGEANDKDGNKWFEITKTIGKDIITGFVKPLLN